MDLKKIDPTKIDGNFIKLIGTDWMLITSGGIDSFNMMTASWGAIGYIWGLPSATVYVRPTRYTKQWIDRTHSMTLTFFPDKYKKQLTELGTKSGRDMDKMKDSGLTPMQLPSGDVGYEEAALTLVCRVVYSQEMVQKGFDDPAIMPKWYPKGPADLHTMYITEITAAYKRSGFL